MTLPIFLSRRARLTISGWLAARGMTLGAAKASGAARKYTCRTWLWISSAMSISLRRARTSGVILTPKASSVAWMLAVVCPTEQMPQMRQVSSDVSRQEQPLDHALKDARRLDDLQARTG